MRVETTLKQLSQISGFSISTVSKALKNNHEISIETRKKIKALASSYNYVPNNSAVALRSKRTNTIAVVVPKIDNVIYGSLLNSIQEEASKLGYHVILQQYSNFKNGSYASLENLRDGCVDGIMIIQSLSDRAFSTDISQLSDVGYYPTLICTIDNLTLELEDYRILGRKNVIALFSKIDAKNRELTYKTY